MSQPPPPSTTKTPIPSTVDSGLPPFGFAAAGGRLTSVTSTPIPDFAENVDVLAVGVAEPDDRGDAVVLGFDTEVPDGCSGVVVECRDVGGGDVGCGVVRGAAGPGRTSAGVGRGCTR